MAMMPPVPYRVPMTNPRDGTVSRNWAQWFEALLARIGGVGQVAAVNEVEMMVETDTPPETQAYLHRLERRIADLEALLLWQVTLPVTAAREPDLFDNPSVADMQALKQALADQAVLGLFQD